jgi:hypothetical protein
MKDRLAEGASNRTINMELGVLSRAVGYPFKLLWPKASVLKSGTMLGGPKCAQ